MGGLIGCAIRQNASGKVTHSQASAPADHLFHPGKAEFGGFFADGFRHEGVVAGGFEVVGGLAL